MAKKHVIIELTYQKDLAALASAAESNPTMTLDTSPVAGLAGVEIDPEFPPTALPGRVARLQSESVYDVAPFELSLEPKDQTYIVRAQVDEKRVEEITANPRVVGVFSDPVIEPTIVCPGSPPVGTDADVERLLCTAGMRSAGMDGNGVLIAIVDTGVNLAYLNSRGKNPGFDAGRSWVPRAGLVPGQLPVGHGTMCAYDACIAAPNCTLLDIALLQSNTTGPTVMSGFLSDAVRAYRHLINVVIAPKRPGESRSLVVNNSWGMFHPSWDFPPGNPGNYSDNPNHPFNRIVADLERAGADILFAAGNCGANCPDGRCQGVTANAIYGANGHPAVLCIAGVDTTKARVGYSTVGPGRLTRNKPDLSGYTHFRGSGVYAADGGTSAATPVVTGVVAAVRSKKPYDASNPSTHPAAIRTLMTSTAQDLGTTGYDFEHGFGVVNGCELRRRFAGGGIAIDWCKKYPWLCGGGIWDICRRYPWICRGIPVPPIPVPPQPGPPGPPPFSADAENELTGSGGEQGVEPPDALTFAYLAGYLAAQQSPPDPSGGPTGTPKSHRCSCGGS